MLTANPTQAAGYAQSSDKSCDNYRSLSIPTPAGVCVSLIASGLGFPRGVVSLSNTQVLVADMGSWERGRGRLLLIDVSPTGDAPKVQILLARLDRPHGMARGPDGRLWLGEATRISEIKLEGTNARLSPVMVGAPGTGRHPLIGLAVMGNGQIAFSTGSVTDDCDGAMVRGVCTEAAGPNARASIRAFTPTGTPQKWIDIPPFATGLRNSAALAFDPRSQTLWAGENGMDLTSLSLPPDELNKIEAGKNYGWPACYGMAVRAAGFGASSCRETAVPARNLPAHSAPLGATIIEGGLARTGRAIALTLHGYQPSGHRVILIPVNARGVRPTGTPVGIAPAPGGGLYVTEDANGNLLRISVQPE